MSATSSSTADPPSPSPSPSPAPSALSASTSKADKARMEKERAKIARKRARLVDPTANLTTRVKSLVSLVQHDSEEGCGELFANHHALVLQAFTDTMGIHDANAKKGKHCTEKDIKVMQTMLRLISLHLSSDVRDPRTNRQMLGLMEKMLYIENAVSVRQTTFEILMLMGEAFPAPDDQIVKLLISSLHLVAFQGEAGLIAILPSALSAPDKYSAYFPGPVSGKNECRDFLELYFHYTARSPTAFNFWFPTTRQILALLYPDVSALIEVPNTHPDHGFKKGSCPPELQAVVESNLCTWLESDKLCPILLADPKQYQLVLEVYRSCLRMPSTLCKTISHCINTYATLFIYNWKTRQLPNMTDILNYQKLILEEMVTIFGFSVSKNPSDHVIQDAVIKYFFQMIEAYDSLEPATRTVFLLTLCKCATTLITSATASVPSGEPVKGVLIDTLLTAWITSKMTEWPMWQELHKCLEACAQCNMEVLNQIKIKLEHLSNLLIDMCYPLAVKLKTPAATEGSDTRKQKKDTVLTLESRDLNAKRTNRDPHLEKLPLQVDLLTWLWHAVLHSFTNISQFKSPKNYEGGIAVITGIMDMFLNAEELAEIEKPVITDSKRLPLYRVFCPYLFEATVNDESRSGGTSLAFGSLCRLFCRTYPAVPVQLLSHFYTALRRGLKSNDKNVWWQIIANGYNMFSIALPGSCILIPYFLPRLKEMLTTSTSSTPPYGKQKCIAMLSSLICFPSHFPNLHLNTYPPGSVLTSVALRNFVQDTLTAALGQCTSVDTRISCLWSLTVCIFENCAHWNSENVADLIQVVLVCAGSEDVVIARTALQCVSLIGNISKKLPQDLLTNIFETLCSYISPNKISEIAPYIYFCLCDWVISDAVSETFQDKLFQAIEFGLSFGEKQEVQEVHSLVAARPAQADPSVSDKKKGLLSSKKGLMSIRPRKEPSGTATSGAQPAVASNAPPPDSAAYNENDPSDKRVTLREAAEILLLHTLHFFHNFPSPEGIDMWCSQINETDDGALEEHATYWIFNNMLILTVLPIPKMKNATARMIIRDAVGKWVWDFHNVNTIGETGLPEGVITAADQPVAEDEPSAKDRRTKTIMTTPSLLSSNNKVSELLARLETQHPELLQWVPSFKDPSVILAPIQPALDQIEENLESFIQSERSVTTIHPPHQHGQFPQPPPPSQPQSPVHYTRMILQQLGLTSPLSPIPPLLDRISLSDKFRRNITLLDKTHGREVYKLGLIYVAEGQETQNDILANTQLTASNLYTDFANGLGWRVDVSTHRGYLGGLDKNQSTGHTTLYWANSTLEVIFHEVVQMPTVESDPQQIQKKRHVGNDFVHIIWSDHLRDYNPLTITSQFNDAHIIIYPLPNGLFRIQTYKKPTHTVYGPLQSGMVINKELLSTLVRETAVNANRAISAYRNPDAYTRPYLNRRRYITETIDRYKSDAPYLTNLTSVITGLVQQSTTTPNNPGSQPPPDQTAQGNS
ncbi:ral GTPase-activating protein subunit alpha-2 [Pelomyxa schiedti]|nr:ral GTPase-activating protein subunit alpha-2 [Pelomyxa schiedti]